MPEGRFLPARAIPINGSRTRAAPNRSAVKLSFAAVCCSATNPA